MTILRALFFGLLLINVLLFALGLAGVGSGQRGDTSRLANQLSPERIRIVAPASQPAPAAPAAVPAASGAPAEPQASALACHRWEGLSAEQAQRIAELAAGADLKADIVAQPVGEPTSFWVHLPPAADRDILQKRVAELKQAGVSDYFVVQEKGPQQLAVSLGLFKTRGPANDLLERLRGKGIADARIEERGAITKTKLDLRGAAPALAAAVQKIATDLPEAKGGDCPAG